MHPSLTSPSLNTDKVFECTSYDFICLGLVNGFIFVHLRESERLSCSIHGNFSVCWELCIVRRLYLAAFHFFLFPWFQILLFFFSLSSLYLCTRCSNGRQTDPRLCENFDCQYTSIPVEFSWPSRAAMTLLYRVQESDHDPFEDFSYCNPYFSQED